MTGILEDIIQSFQTLFDMVLAIFDFVFLGKNLRIEFIDVLESLLIIGLIIIGFKVIFARTDSIIGKIIVITLFILIYLVTQIWIF